jgi:DNA-binding NarL/FixJ family response regulator
VIRVVIVEDQTIVRQGLRSVLALLGDIEVAGEAADGVEALEVIAAARPDVVLLDLRMPKLDGVGVLKRLRETAGSPPALILTTFDDDELLFEAIRAGAKGYMLKDVAVERLAEAIRAIAAGGTRFEPVVTERIFKSIGENPPAFGDDVLPEPLTDREIDVLRLMAGGYNNREIGDLLHLSEGTVKNHISSLLAKLGVRDRTRAVLKAIAKGIL